MTNNYKIVFISNQPSFYKVRLWNELSKKARVFAIFTEIVEKDRNKDFIAERPSFDFCILQSRGSLAKVWEARRIVKGLKYDKLIIGGWESLVALMLPFLCPKTKNGVFVESSVYEYKPSMLKDLIKRLYFARISIAYPSGFPQKALIDKFAYKGKYKYTGGCGLLNYVCQPAYEARSSVSRFLYVGRLVPVKNLEMLIRIFNSHPELQLTIVGFGELESHLKSMAMENVKFIGAVNNKDLPGYYKRADVFILPSIVEPWGLVVEEALNNGTPVIVSDRVGCKDDLVTVETGLIFRYDSEEELENSIMRMREIEFYNGLRLGVSRMNFALRSQKQIDVYLDSDDLS